MCWYVLNSAHWKFKGYVKSAYSQQDIPKVRKKDCDIIYLAT